MLVVLLMSVLVVSMMLVKASALPWTCTQDGETHEGCGAGNTTKCVSMGTGVHIPFSEGVIISVGGGAIPPDGAIPFCTTWASLQCTH